MNSRIRTIFLCSMIGCQTGTKAFFGEHTLNNVCKKTKKIYQKACEKTRALCEKTKEHKKIVAGIAVYLAFEIVGYSQGWDTPLRRLFTPKKRLDDANATIQGHAAEIDRLATDHQQELQEQQDMYQKLEQQYQGLPKRNLPHKSPQEEFTCQELQKDNEGLKDRLQALEQELEVELQRKKQVEEVSREMNALTQQTMSLMSEWGNFRSDK